MMLSVGKEKDSEKEGDKLVEDGTILVDRPEENISLLNNLNNLNNEKKDNLSGDKRKKKFNQMAYLIISFHQGVASISDLATNYFFKDNLHLDPASLSQVMSFIFLPWMIKPLFGLLTDLLPICGYRRKIYIILCGLVSMAGWLLMSFYVHTLLQATAVLFLINVAISFSTVLGEAIVVELSQLDKTDQGENAKDYVSLFFLCKYVGVLASAYLKGYLVEVMNVRSVFLVSSGLPWLLILSGFILIENRYEFNETSSTTTTKPDLVSQFLTFMCQKYVVVPTLFIIAFMATPSYGDPLFYFLTNQLKFSPGDLGLVALASTIATLLAILMYKYCFKNTNFKMMITVGTVISFVLSFMAYILVKRINVQLGISDFILYMLSNSFQSLIGELILMPMLSLACMLCPKNLEGTVYALFMSALNFGSILSGLNGSFITSYLGITATEYKNLDKLILISNVITLLPLPLLCCISSSYFHPESKEEKEKLNDHV